MAYSVLADLEKQISRQVLNDLTIDDDNRQPENGTGTIISSGTAVTGTGTSFTTELEVDGDIVTGGETRTVRKITSDTSIVIDLAFTSDITVAANFEYRKYIDSAVITEAIAKADALIDMYYNRAGITVPITAVDNLTRSFSVDIAIYNLFSRKGLPSSGEGVDFIIVQRYETAIDILKTWPDDSTVDSGETASFFQSDARIFTYGDMEGF